MLSDVAFTAYAQEYMDMVFRVAFHWLGSRADADDVTQNVFLKLYREERAFESEAHVKHWLLRVAVNECKKILRAPWRRCAPIEGNETYLPASPPPSEEHAALMDAVLRLKPKYRAAVYLFYYEDCTTEEIAKLLNIPRATVLTHLRRAREALREELTKEA